MFLSCGDALFDVFTGATPSLTQMDLTARIGGSPLNVALGLARLGRPVGYLTANSTDVMGQQIQAFMQAEGIDTSNVVRTSRNTSLAMVSLGEQGHPSYSFYIEGGADVSLEVSDLPDPNQFQAISLGSYSTVVEPCASSLQTLVQRCSADTLVAYDPNVRPSIQPNAKVWWRTFEAIAARADVIKLSDEDIDFLAPGQSLDAFAERALSYGAKWVLMTRGGAGAVAYSSIGQTIEVPGRQVVVQDTVGAGDTFQAAMLDAIAEQDKLTPSAVRDVDMERVLNWAVTAAAITCSRRGADLPTRKDVEEALS